MGDRLPYHPTMIVPVGTRVVLRAGLAARDAAAGQPAGAVGVVVKSPGDQRHSYRVRFVDGTEAPLRRTEFVLLKEMQAEAAGAGGRRGTAETDVVLSNATLRSSSGTAPGRRGRQSRPNAP